MQHALSKRVAWLIPDIGTGGISFQHILSEFAKIHPNTITFTGRWPGYATGFEESFEVEQLGTTRYIELFKESSGYPVGFSYVSPKVIQKLLQFKPDIVFANAFSAWTVFALIFKFIGRWKVVITYEGGSPSYENQSFSIRLFVRKVMGSLADAFAVNSKVGRAYLTNVLGIPEDRIFTRPFLVPSEKALLQYAEDEVASINLNAKRPVFLYVGQIVPRKGLKVLLEACALLKQKGYQNYTLRIVGDGEQRSELQIFAEEVGISDQVEWLGKIEYRCLGAYFKSADVFVFPTYEDIWGMVLPEAMLFGKPVISSKGAGAVEIMVEGENGFLYQPDEASELAECMSNFVKDPSLIRKMGQSSLVLMKENTPEHAIRPFNQALEKVLKL